jgi:5-methylcytosine-specific restriction endonuclease McrA
MKHRRGIELAAERSDDPPLARLEQWYELGAICRVCNHAKPVDRYELARQFGEDRRLSFIASKLVCKECGNRKGNRLMLVTLPR